MVHKISPVDGLSPLGIKQPIPWKPVVATLLLLSLIGLLLWWYYPGDPERGKTTILKGTNDSVKLDTSKPITEVKVQLTWKAKIDLDLDAFYRTKTGEYGLIDYREMSAPGIALDTDAGVNEEGGRNKETITITSLDQYQEIWFVTHLFSRRGTYNDYDGRVTLKTNNGDKHEVPLTSTESKPYLVIAKLTNGPDGPVFSSLNKAAECEELGDFLGMGYKCSPLEPKTAR